jgi:hypothetical protein
MKCLNDEEIQKYLDGELSEYSANEVGEHLNICMVCRKNFVTVREMKSQIFSLFDEITTAEIPIAVPTFHTHKQTSGLRNIIAIATVAASILIFIGLGVNIKKKMVIQKQRENSIKAIYEFTHNTDPNKMLHEKQIIIVVTNSSGEVVETSVTE